MASFAGCSAEFTHIPRAARPAFDAARGAVPECRAMAWERPYHAAGGGDARLRYVVPGAAPARLRVSRARYRIDAVPDLLAVVACGPREAGLEAARADPVLAEALDDALGAGAAAVAAASAAAVVHGVFPDPASLVYLRDTLAVVAALLDTGGLAVLDPSSLRWWSPEEFREKVHGRDEVDAFQHVTVLRSEEPGGTWLHTRGLVKFGRPDLSVPGVQPSWYPDAVELVERLTWAQVRGHVIPEGQVVRMAGVPDGLVCRRAGSPDDPGFGNVHVRIARG